MSELIGHEISEAIVHLRLKRASKKNALTSDMYQTLSRYLNAAAEDDQVRVVVLSADGDDFCAGNDILDFMQSGFLNGRVEDLPVFQFLKAINYFPKPLIAAVQGQAVGVGTTMLLHCDLVYLSGNARLSLPFVQLGLVPEAGSSGLLPKLVGHQRAFAWMTLGETLAAPEALRLNLATAVVDDEVSGAAMAAARKLARLSPDALRYTKSLMRDPDDLWKVILEEGRIFRERLTSPEAAQAFAAFMNKSA